MPRKYIPAQFAPRLYAEWGELLEGCATEKKAEYLMAIIKFPNIDIPNDPIWNFIKSQLAKDYYNFIETCKANSKNSSNYWAEKRKAKGGERSLPLDIPLLRGENEGEPKQKQLTQTPTEIETEIETETGIFLLSEKKKSDPYINPIAEFYKKTYKEILGTNCYLSNEHRNKIIELASDIEDFKDTIPTVLKKLKDLKFDDINFKPSSTWLLKNDNYIKVLEGTFDKEHPLTAEEIKQKVMELRAAEGKGECIF